MDQAAWGWAAVVGGGALGIWLLIEIFRRARFLLGIAAAVAVVWLLGGVWNDEFVRFCETLAGQHIVGLTIILAGAGYYLFIRGRRPNRSPD